MLRCDWSSYIIVEWITQQSHEVQTRYSLTLNTHCQWYADGLLKMKLLGPPGSVI